jgi:hypothetical protein
VCGIVYCCSDNGADGELSLVDGEGDAAEMGGRNFVHVDLGEGEEPADRESWAQSVYGDKSHGVGQIYREGSGRSRVR